MQPMAAQASKEGKELTSRTSRRSGDEWVARFHTSRRSSGRSQGFCKVFGYVISGLSINLP